MQSDIIVQISDAEISTNAADRIVTYSLGSCIGLCLYDYSQKIGGMLHFQLPDSKIDSHTAATNPFKFADTGTEALFNKLLSLGAHPKKIKVAVAGGASMDAGPKGFDIGKRNILAIRKTLWQKGLFIDAEDIGSNGFRNLYLSIHDGTVTVKTAENTRTLLTPTGLAAAKQAG